MIKGGRLRFSTDHLLAIDAILRERLAPISRYGWVLDGAGDLVSSCGGPVTELTTVVGELVRSSNSSNRIITGLEVPLPPPDARFCPLVAVQIEPLGILVATSGAEVGQEYHDALLAIADLLGPIFDAARGTA